jgi:hypothetical protein
MCQGIHRWLFITWNTIRKIFEFNKDARARYAILKERGSPDSSTLGHTDPKIEQAERNRRRTKESGGRKCDPRRIPSEQK